MKLMARPVTRASAPAKGRAREPEPEAEPEAQEQEGALTVFDELLTAVQTVDPAFADQGRKETTHAYMQRFVKGIAAVDEDTWNALSDEATEWNNATVKAIKAKKEYDLPEGFEDPEADAGGADPEVEPEDPPARRPAPAKKGAAPAAPARPAPAPAKKAAAPAARQQRTLKDGYTMREMRRAVVKNPNMTVDDLEAEATENGVEFSRNSINLALQTTRTVIDLAKEEGHWKN
jgi:hypothetical protein